MNPSKYLFKSLAVIAISALALVALVTPAKAQEVKNADNITIAKNQTVSSGLIVNANVLNIEGTVDGDLFCVGGQLIISGRVNGDVYCVAQSISMSGKIDGSARLLATDMTIAGDIASSASLFSENFTLTDKAKVGRDLSIFATKARFNGAIGRDLVMMLQTAELGGYVGRNVSGRVMNLTLNSNADVRGDVSVISPNQPIKLSGADVAGQTKITAASDASSAGMSIGAFLLVYLGFVLSLLLVSMLSVWAMPKFFENSSAVISKSVLRSTLYGLANLFLVPIVFSVLMVSVIGIPLGGLIAVAWILSLFLSGPVFAYYVGQKFLRKKQAAKNRYAVMFAGSVVILVLYLIPVVNILTGLAVALVGGGALLYRFKHQSSGTK